MSSSHSTLKGWSYRYGWKVQGTHLAVLQPLRLKATVLLVASLGQSEHFLGLLHVSRLRQRPLLCAELSKQSTKTNHTAYQHSTCNSNGAATQKDPVLLLLRTVVRRLAQRSALVCRHHPTSKKNGTRRNSAARAFSRRNDSFSNLRGTVDTVNAG